jgi:branched-chain amino acid transport system ATP-binding protein
MFVTHTSENERPWMLDLSGVQSSYGRSQVLFGIDLAVRTGEVVTILGRNGMGKTTAVRCITGLLRINAGSVKFDGKRIDDQPSYRICQKGIALVPEGRQIFPNLTVRENLICNGVLRDKGQIRWTLERVLQLFPRLAERLNHGGTSLSGGEQQMLAIGRALMTNPRLLILDEATEGLAPLVREEIWQCILDLKRDRLSILLIDKNLNRILEVADRHYIVEKGRIVWEGATAAFRANQSVTRRYLEINSQADQP